MSAQPRSSLSLLKSQPKRRDPRDDEHKRASDHTGVWFVADGHLFRPDDPKRYFLLNYRNAVMPVLAFFSIVVSVLFALLFVADATLENSSPAIVTSQRTGLPAPRYHNTIKTLTTASAPAPDMTSQAVLAAQPKSASDALAKIEAGAGGALAAVPPERAWGEVSAKKTRTEALPQNRPVAQSINPQHNQFDRFSIKGY